MICEKLFQQILSVVVQLNPIEHDFQKQLFANALQNSCSEKFCKIHMKTSYTCNFVKWRLNRWCFPDNLSSTLPFFATQWTNKNQVFFSFLGMLFIISFDRNEYHKFCNCKTILHETNEGALKDLLKLTGKHLHRSVFFNEVTC